MKAHQRVCLVHRERVTPPARIAVTVGFPAERGDDGAQLLLAHGRLQDGACLGQGEGDGRRHLLMVPDGQV